MTKENIVNEDIAMLPISAIAQSLGVNQRTLRIWDKEEILSPKRTAKNRRHYSLNDLKKGRFIVFLMRNLAIGSISGVKIVFKLLEKNNIKKENYMSYMEEIALLVGIDENVQKENIEKTSNKGAKPKNNKNNED